MLFEGLLMYCPCVGFRVGCVVGLVYRVACFVVYGVLGLVEYLVVGRVLGLGVGSLYAEGRLGAYGF